MMSPWNHQQEKSSVYYHLLEAFGARGCAVCTVLVNSVRSSLASLLYESVNDSEVRKRLRQSLGFCREHVQTLLSIGDPLGIAIIYQDIVQNLRNALAGSDTGALTPSLDCPACTFRRRIERNNVDLLAAALDSTEFQNAFRSSDGLCLTHLSQLLEYIQDVTTKDELLTIHREKLAVHRAHLAEFGRKQNFQFRHEIVTPEEDASCERAIDTLVGKID